LVAVVGLRVLAAGIAHHRMTGALLVVNNVLLPRILHEMSKEREREQMSSVHSLATYQV
jgi:hypothetical protein